MNNSQAGFTLIELLVVIAIVGILSAIAIPQFRTYQAKAFDAAARADLRNAAVAEEAYFVESNNYVNCSDAGCITALPILKSLTTGVTLALSGTATGFIGTATNVRGSGTAYTWDSSNGGMQMSP